MIKTQAQTRRPPKDIRQCESAATANWSRHQTRERHFQVTLGMLTVARKCRKDVSTDPRGVIVFFECPILQGVYAEPASDHAIIQIALRKFAEMSLQDRFTDEELMAYIDERLPSDRAAEVERQLRSSSSLSERLVELLERMDRGDITIGGMWRRGRWSCPPRAVLAGFVSGRLGDGLSQYLRFHIQTVGCRICEAIVQDLRRTDGEEEGLQRTRKIFQSSAGQLRNPQG